ncbi:F-box/kelch-repeat protein at1g57790 [Phtheirospermum japonicum]|uniref:F-box/kelch-repeat protein at1g57790 n=1 Tax=Phtheirospermum japonicum TaxID=374723 RepID=A0A830C0M6_9LAMI|nr:F-box/kelch-repeat protein at1g57790 [Phtheirospermum japonicum]GFP92677.1 F-box/kelch-repeat protein at1g57790 [Phtheirospermum japonicum]
MGNWADLPPELINLILSKVFAKDRFSLVCRSWNAAATTNCYSVPCLMYYYRRTRTWKFHRHNSSFFISFPQLKDAEIHCSKYGWLLMARYDNTLFFFNPSNNQTVKLPCRIGFAYTKVFFFHPPTSPDCTVVGIKTPIWKQAVVICMLKRGESQWESIEYPTKTQFLLSHAPPVLHRGQIYFLDVIGNVARFNVINRRLVISEKCLRQQQRQPRELHDNKIKEHYLFKVKGEEALFGVFVFHDERNVKVFMLSEKPREVKVLMPKKMKWELVEDIGDKVLYLSHASSFGCTARTKIMANRIYFPKLHGDSVVFYSLSDGKYHSLNGDYSDNNAYGLKRLDFAAWVTPAPITTSKLAAELRWRRPQVDQHGN